ncbi:peptidoglycan DD-metalloendopeptidase family protein [Wenzhouxiangella marina]|uniref:Peptidase M23 n=1 Tax=Wenzhouxiangella marina TaxID=1579979 RepID=A0A0K0XZR7_9GAMM|nr:Peptidase M23 [Wenzhouxiangella marina]MBB6087150.1 murein DD-endopeptidase MepM/ murein hydrolase activator NlpD [Wenzhouxiangella marina]
MLASRFLLIIALLGSGACWAQTIYSWTDENGITHFTDRRPVTEQEVTVQRSVARQPESLLEMVEAGTPEAPVWKFRNRSQGPLGVRVWLEDAENVVSYPELPADFVLPGGAVEELVTIGAFDPRKPWRYRILSEAAPGDPRAVHAPTRPYRPPFATNERFIIGQAFGGEYSHDTPASAHAVDIPMEVGTPVHAARGGVVMDVARWFARSGTDLKRDGPRANYIRILHEDGSMAVYAHLDYEGVLVRPGDRVRRGQMIGRSGNTGFSTGPHLHFVVQLNRDMKLYSVPFEFSDETGQGVTPEPGLLLKAVD